MLMQPAHRYFPEFRVTAFRDDANMAKFYLIPDYLQIRRDFKGNPVFLLVKYAFDDQDRAANPNLPRGGGYMVFDVEMSVREADYKQIVAQLQKDVDDMWNQLKALADSAGKSVQGARLRSWHALPGLNTSVSLGVDDVLLGLGEDGHTASLFPGHDWGAVPGAPDALAVFDAPKPPPERVSLSAARLSRARQAVFLVSGAAKRQAVTLWRAGADLPARAIAPAAGVDILLEADLLSPLRQ